MAHSVSLTSRGSPPHCALRLGPSQLVSVALPCRPLPRPTSPIAKQGPLNFLSVERLHGEIKRRIRAAGAFPDRASALRLITAVAIKATTIWGDRRYLDLSLLETQESFLSAVRRRRLSDTARSSGSYFERLAFPAGPSANSTVRS